MIAFVDCAVAAAEAHTHRPQAAAVRCIQRSESSLAKSNEGWHTSSRLLLLLNQTHMSAHTLQYVHDTTRHDTTQQSSLPNPNQSQALATTTERPTSLRTWGSWMPCDFCETLEPCVISFWGCGPCVHTHTHGMMHMRGCAALKMQPPYPQILPYTRTGSRAAGQGSGGQRIEATEQSYTRIGNAVCVLAAAASLCHCGTHRIKHAMPFPPPVLAHAHDH